MTLKRLLLSRGTVLALLVVVTAMMVVASIVPQRFMTAESAMAEWRADHPLLARLVVTSGLDHAYTHPIFGAALVLALMALGYSTVEQLRTAARRSWPRSARAVAGPSIELAADGDTVARVMLRRGYRVVWGGGAERLLVRNPWGYWGNFFLHLGLTVIAAASMLIGTTQQRSVLHLVEGETFRSGGPWVKEENGLAASRLVLPFSVRLDHLEYDFSPPHGLQRARSTLSLLRPEAPPTMVKVGINDLQMVDGVRIYQGAELGHAFVVQVQHGSNADLITLLVQHPDVPDLPGVNEFRGLLPAGEVLRVKYFVDAEQRTFDHFNPLLVLRVDGPGGSIGERQLRPGTEAEIGPYRFRLEQVRLWTRLFFVNVTGIAGIFAGFFVIALGGILHYFTPPREAALVETQDGTTRMTWRATRFASFYLDEYEEIRAAVSSGGPRD